MGGVEGRGQRSKSASVLSFSFLCRIFVNRSLALEKIKCFGFDMDYTLASEWEAWAGSGALGA